MNTVECASIDLSEGPTRGEELPWYKAARAALSVPCPGQAHHCHCAVVHDCPIMVHPDPAVQRALADLSEEAARYDDETGSRTTLMLHTDRADGGTFHSLTVNALSVPCPASEGLRSTQRLWDLVRYQRGELHTAGLITDAEYAELVVDHAAVARLETYDQLRADLTDALEALRPFAAAIHASMNNGRYIGVLIPTDEAARAAAVLKKHEARTVSAEPPAGREG